VCRHVHHTAVPAVLHATLLALQLIGVQQPEVQAQQDDQVQGLRTQAVPQIIAAVLQAFVVRRLQDNEAIQQAVPLKERQHVRKAATKVHTAQEDLRDLQIEHIQNRQHGAVRQVQAEVILSPLRAALLRQKVTQALLVAGARQAVLIIEAHQAATGQVQTGLALAGQVAVLQEDADKK